MIKAYKITIQSKRPSELTGEDIRFFEDRYFLIEDDMGEAVAKAVGRFMKEYSMTDDDFDEQVESVRVRRLIGHAIE